MNSWSDGNRWRSRAWGHVNFSCTSYPSATSGNMTWQKFEDKDKPIMLKRCFMSLYMPTHHHPLERISWFFWGVAKNRAAKPGSEFFGFYVGRRWEKAAGLHSAKQLGYLMGWQRIWLCVLVCTFFVLVEGMFFLFFLEGRGHVEIWGGELENTWLGGSSGLLPISWWV